MIIVCGVTAVESELLRSQAYVAGSWVDADDGATFSVLDPATGETLGEVPRMGAAETRRAIEAARRALPAWRRLLAKERARILRRWADLMLEHGRSSRVLMTASRASRSPSRRPRSTMRPSFYEWFGEEAKRVYGDTIPTRGPTAASSCSKEPVGVTAGITPWNFPAAMVTRKSRAGAGGGLHDGAEAGGADAPLGARASRRSARRRACRRACSRSSRATPRTRRRSGREMTSNPLVRKLGFTGSTEVGKLLMAQCAGQVKKVSLELGGNAPFIVFDDADLDEAVAGALVCKYRNSGPDVHLRQPHPRPGRLYDEFVAAADRRRGGARGRPTASTRGSRSGR